MTTSSAPLSSPLAATLAKRWTGLWKKLGVAVAPDIAPVLAAYAAPERHYHNLAHLQGCLAVYDRNPMQDPVAELAIWTHDVVYDPRRSDNEEASAALCAGWFATVLPAAHIRTLGDLIIATRHEAHPAWIAAQVVADTDLAVFASDAEGFASYEQQVRAEYAFLDDATWRKGRQELLARFLNRPRIYLTAWFHDQFDAAARRNLNQAIRRLAAARTERVG